MPGFAVLLVFLIFGGGGIAEVEAQEKPGYQILNKRKVAEFPFRLINNLIVIPVSFENVIPLQFILDTGARNTILTQREYSDFLGVSYVRKFIIRGAGKHQEVEALLAAGVSLRLPDVQASGQSIFVLQKDYLELGSQLGTPVHGILGYDLFRQFVVKIDYHRQLITLYDPQKFKAGRRYTRIDLEIEGEKPYIICKIQEDRHEKTNSIKLMVDTGASHAVLLHQDDSSSLFNFPEKTIYAHIGRGLAGDIRGHVGRVHSFLLGGFCFGGVLTSYPDNDSYASVSGDWDNRAGTMGGDVLRRFTVVFDYVNGAIYLRRNNRFKDPFIYSKTGMEVESFGDNLERLKVSQIREDSPAGKSGIKVGDEIRVINGFRVSSLSLPEIIEMFNKRDGKKVRLQMKRGEEDFKVVFRLRNII